jgi:hypothetical protein
MSKRKPNYVIVAKGPGKDRISMGFTEEVEKSIIACLRDEGFTFHQLVTEAILAYIIRNEHQREKDILDSL